jgi:hypothetical protein
MGRRLLVYVLAFVSTALSQGPWDSRIERLPLCERAAMRPPASWPVFAPPNTTLSIQTPPDAVYQGNGSGCVHGCADWNRGSLHIQVMHGAFGPESFETAAWMSACLSERAELRRVELPGSTEHSLVVWPLPIPRADGTIAMNTADFLVAVSWVEDRDRADAFRTVDSLERRAP